MALDEGYRARPRHRPSSLGMALAVVVSVTAGTALGGCGTPKTAAVSTQQATEVSLPSPTLIAEGQQIFRFDTFGDEQVWTDTLRLHDVVEKHVDPTTALTVGLKADAEALPPGILDKVNLKSPATTVTRLWSERLS